jgi:hypothetical protein
VLGRELYYQDLLDLTELDDESLLSLCEQALAAEILLDCTDGAGSGTGSATTTLPTFCTNRRQRPDSAAGTSGRARSSKPAPTRRRLSGSLFGAPLLKGGRRLSRGNVQLLGRPSCRAGLCVERRHRSLPYSVEALGECPSLRGRARRGEPQAGRPHLSYGHRRYGGHFSPAPRPAGIPYVGDVAGQVQVHTWLALEHSANTNLLLRDQIKAEAHLQAAHRLAAESGGAADLCNLLLTHALAQAFMLDVHGVEAAARQARKVAEQSGNVAAGCQAESLLGLTLASSGRIAEGRVLLERWPRWPPARGSSGTRSLPR